MNPTFNYLRHPFFNSFWTYSRHYFGELFHRYMKPFLQKLLRDSTRKVSNNSFLDCYKKFLKNFLRKFYKIRVKILFLQIFAKSFSWKIFLQESLEYLIEKVSLKIYINRNEIVFACHEMAGERALGIGK